MQSLRYKEKKVSKYFERSGFEEFPQLDISDQVSVGMKTPQLSSVVSLQDLDFVADRICYVQVPGFHWESLRVVVVETYTFQLCG